MLRTGQQLLANVGATSHAALTTQLLGWALQYGIEEDQL